MNGFSFSLRYFPILPNHSYMYTVKLVMNDDENAIDIFFVQEIFTQFSYFPLILFHIQYSKIYSLNFTRTGNRSNV